MYVYARYKHFWLHFNVLKTMNVCVQSTVMLKDCLYYQVGGYMFKTVFV